MPEGLFDIGGLFNAIGSVGVALILYSYHELQKQRMKYDSPRYLWLNLSGAVLITISLLKHWNLPSFLIEIAWIYISAGGLWKAHTKKRKKKK